MKTTNKDLPIATVVINEYKEINQKLQKTNERLIKTNKIIGSIALILLLLFVIETTYIILYWDTMHPHAGVIQQTIDE